MSAQPAAPPSEWELRVQVPPGWIELVAHENEDTALAAFDEILQPHRDSLPAEEAARLRCHFMRPPALHQREPADWRSRPDSVE